MIPIAESAPQRLERQQRLIREAVRALRAKRPIPFSLAQPQERDRLREIQEYFDELRLKVTTKDYPRWIRRFEQVNREELEFTGGEYHRQWRRGPWPFIPPEDPLDDMPKLTELAE